MQDDMKKTDNLWDTSSIKASIAKLVLELAAGDYEWIEHTITIQIPKPLTDIIVLYSKLHKPDCAPKINKIIQTYIQDLVNSQCNTSSFKDKDVAPSNLGESDLLKELVPNVDDLIREMKEKLGALNEGLKQFYTDPSPKLTEKDQENSD